MVSEILIMSEDEDDVFNPVVTETGGKSKRGRKVTRKEEVVENGVIDLIPPQSPTSAIQSSWMKRMMRKNTKETLRVDQVTNLIGGEKTTIEMKISSRKISREEIREMSEKNGTPKISKKMLSRKTSTNENESDKKEEKPSKGSTPKGSKERISFLSRKNSKSTMAIEVDKLSDEEGTKVYEKVKFRAPSARKQKEQKLERAKRAQSMSEADLNSLVSFNESLGNKSPSEKKNRTKRRYRRNNSLPNFNAEDDDQNSMDSESSKQSSKSNSMTDMDLDEGDDDANTVGGFGISMSSLLPSNCERSSPLPDNNNNNIPKIILQVQKASTENLKFATEIEESILGKCNYIPSVKVQEVVYPNTDTEELDDNDNVYKTLVKASESLKLPTSGASRGRHRHRSSSPCSSFVETNNENEAEIAIRSRALSLPANTLAMNAKELSRLSGLHEKAKRNDTALTLPLGIYRKYARNPEKDIQRNSFFDRVTKKLSPSTGKRESRSRSSSPCRMKEAGKGSSSDAENVSPPPNLKRKMQTNGHLKLLRKLPPPNDNMKTNCDGKTKTKTTTQECRLTRTTTDGKIKTITSIEKKSSYRVGAKFARKSTKHSDKLLENAVKEKNIVMLEKLLTEEIFVTEINYLEQPSGVSVFHQACKFGDINVINLLLAKGADVGLKTTQTELSPLRIAVIFGHYEVAKLLLTMGADLKDIRDGFQGYQKL